MNLLIINQPVSNYGDLAAHRSLMRSLKKSFPQIFIRVLFHKLDEENKAKMNVTDSDYVGLSGRGGKFILLAKLVFFARYILHIPTSWTILFCSLFNPDIKATIRYVKAADYVLCAPGGISMGTFQNWQHIFFLEIARCFNKKLAYYSRSWGPFAEKTFWNRVYKKASLRLLNSFDFHSIRDAKTMKMADDLGLKYVPSIDTVFVDKPRVEIPCEIQEWLGNSAFRVFVPNTLVWHRDYRQGSPEKIRSFYLQIMTRLLEKYPEDRIVLLPQLYARGNKGDETYFRELQQNLNDDRVYVVSDKFCSDVQQTLISKSKLVIGARYHSIVFAINNEVPFISLSYEHKMTGLLDVLGQNSHFVNIYDLAKSDVNIDSMMKLFSVELENAGVVDGIREKAHVIAKNCFEKYEEEIRTVLK